MDCFTVKDLKLLCKKSSAGLNRNEICKQINLNEESLNCLTASVLKKVAKKVALKKDIESDEIKMIQKFKKKDLVKWLFLQLNEKTIKLTEIKDELVNNINFEKPFTTNHDYSSMDWDKNSCPIELNEDQFEKGNIIIKESNFFSDCIPTSKKYKKVAKNIIELMIPYKDNWNYLYHDVMPGLQFTNMSKSKVNYEWENEVINKDNHWTSKFGEYDYCKCRDNGMNDTMVKSLAKPLDDDSWWVRKHGKRYEIMEKIDITQIKKHKIEMKSSNYFTLTIILIDDDEKIQKFEEIFKSEHAAEEMLEKIYKGKNDPLEVHTTWKKIPNSEKQKIKDDVIKAIGKRTYKIHFQPKPEYQVWFIKQLFIVLNKPEILPYIEAFKTVLPYSQVTAGRFIPAVVVYPIEGQKIAKLVLKSIAKFFSPYAEQVGLNIVPRFNHRYDNLTYWANGNGDHKNFLLKKKVIDIFFDYGICSGDIENPYCHYHHWKCPGDSCHIDI